MKRPSSVPPRRHLPVVDGQGLSPDDAASPPTLLRRVAVGAAVMFLAWIPLSFVAGSVVRMLVEPLPVVGAEVAQGGERTAAPSRVASTLLTMAPPITCLVIACVLGGFVAGRLERRELRDSEGDANAAGRSGWKEEATLEGDAADQGGVSQPECSPIGLQPGILARAQVGALAGVLFGASTWLLALVVAVRGIGSTDWVIWLASLGALLLVGGIGGSLGALLGRRERASHPH